MVSNRQKMQLAYQCFTRRK